MKLKKTHICRNGAERELHFPAKYELCGTCKGRGSHVNPSIDGNGLTQEDFAEDSDFKEDYFSGKFDVRCEECGGLRVVLVVDEERLTKRERILLNAIEEAEADAAAERNWHRRMRERGIQY